MSKKNREQQRIPRERKRVAEPAWNETVSGVLEHAGRSNEQFHYTDLVVIAVRKDGRVDILPFSSDHYRLLGIIRWAMDRISKGPGNG